MCSRFLTTTLSPRARRVKRFGNFVATAVHDLGVQGVERFSIGNEPNGKRFLSVRCPSSFANADDRSRRRNTVDLYRVLYRLGYRRAHDAAQLANKTRAGANLRPIRLQVWIGEVAPNPDSRYRTCRGARIAPKVIGAPGYLKRVVMNQDLHAHAVAWHPYQPGSSPRHSKTGKLYGIGRTGFIDRWVDDLKDVGLSRPGGGRASLRFTEFGYLNRRYKKIPCHRDKVQASWYLKALGVAFRPNHGKRTRRARMLVFWKLIEKAGDFDTGMLGDQTEDPNTRQRTFSRYGQVRGYRPNPPYGARRWRAGVLRRDSPLRRVDAEEAALSQAWRLDAGPRAADENCATTRDAIPEP
jgi:hypothetical protein